MTITITLPRAVIEQAIESLQGYARETGDTQPCDAEKALSAALVVADDVLKDAQRYRFLEYQCRVGEYRGIISRKAIDAAMQGGQQ